MFDYDNLEYGEANKFWTIYEKALDVLLDYCFNNHIQEAVVQNEKARMYTIIHTVRTKSLVRDEDGTLCTVINSNLQQARTIMEHAYALFCVEDYTKNKEGDIING